MPSTFLMREFPEVARAIDRMNDRVTSTSAQARILEAVGARLESGCSVQGACNMINVMTNEYTNAMAGRNAGHDPGSAPLGHGTAIRAPRRRGEFDDSRDDRHRGSAAHSRDTSSFDEEDDDLESEYGGRGGGYRRSGGGRGDERRSGGRHDR